MHREVGDLGRSKLTAWTLRDTATGRGDVGSRGMYSGTCGKLVERIKIPAERMFGLAGSRTTAEILCSWIIKISHDDT